MALSTNQHLAPTGTMLPHQEVLIGGFMRHKWMINILPEGQLIFLQIITYLLIGAKSMIKSVPKWTSDEDKTLPEGQLIFLQIITYLLLGAKSMIKSVSKWTLYEGKTLPEVLPIGAHST